MRILWTRLSPPVRMPRLRFGHPLLHAQLTSCHDSKPSFPFFYSLSLGYVGPLSVKAIKTQLVKKYESIQGSSWALLVIPLFNLYYYLHVACCISFDKWEKEEAKILTWKLSREWQPFLTSATAHTTKTCRILFYKKEKSEPFSRGGGWNIQAVCAAILLFPCSQNVHRPCHDSDFHASIYEILNGKNLQNLNFHRFTCMYIFLIISRISLQRFVYHDSSILKKIL